MKLSFHLIPIVVLSSMFWSGVGQLSAQDSDQRYMIDSSVVRYLQDEDGKTQVSQDKDDEVKRAVLDKINPLRKPMSSLTADVRDAAKDAPADWSYVLTNSAPDTWSTYAPAHVGYAWTAPDIRYQPLFFENVKLERYGQTRGPWREVGDSSVHFASSLFLLPYHARFDHVRSCDYPLGFCRPGNYVPSTKQLQWWGW